MAGKNYTTAPSSRQTFNGQRVLRISGLALKIATWNVRSMVADGKLENTLKEMRRMKINILGVSDTQWRTAGSFVENSGEYKIYHSSIDVTTHRYGVAIIIEKEVEKCVTGFVPLSDRVMMLNIASENGVIHIIQVYAPTADKSDEEIETFYEEIESLLKTTKKHDITIILGDFNAKVGDCVVDGITGAYGLGTRNDRGDRLIEFCQSEDMLVTNTTFKLPKRRLYTWKAPSDGINNNVVRNQIDYILVRKRYRNSVKSVKTYPGADVSSDHNPVVAIVKVKLKKVERKKPNIKLDLSKLKNTDTERNLRNKIQNGMRDIKQACIQSDNIELKWENIQSIILTESKQELKMERIKKKVWMSEEILDLMDERRKYKNVNGQKYKEINRKIKNEIRKAKEKFNYEKCLEIEMLDKIHDSFNMHKKIKEMTGTNKKKTVGIIREKNGSIIIDTKTKIRRWTEYVQELFHHSRPEQERDETILGEEYKIMKEEVFDILKKAKLRKAAGPDEVPSELIKLLDDDGIDVLVDLLNAIYTSGEIPKSWLTSTFITLPKKNNPKECSDYRTIALMSHTLKLLLKIIHRRICLKLEREISPSQFGFRQGMGTREALFGINTLVERCLEVNRSIFACFIDFTKAFDNVKHDKLINILKNKNIDNHDIRIISNLYWNQVAKVKVDDELSEDIQIMQGVRQGCVLSPLLFNVYSEAIFEEALLDEHMGIKINGKFINNLRYADDTVILAGTLHHLQRIMEKLNVKCNKYGLMMNVKKTKFMVLTKKQDIAQNNTLKLTINNQIIERVHSYKYLGTWIHSDGNRTKEIRCRIENARSSFCNMRKSFSNRDLPLELRTRMLKCYVFSTLLYGMEAWTLKKADILKLEAFEMWCNRRILNIYLG
uniref:Craniofacial development protein 2 n=1 Tax=Cacopsylla melanoneura TaxID=428564 RepID=A0A8D8V3E1_9HEMI